MDDLQRGYAALDAIKRILRDNDGPGSNPAALSSIRNACIQIRGLDTYVSEKSYRIIGLAERFYSPRKWVDHPGGPDALHSEMLSDLCKRIRDQLDYLETLRKGREQ